MVPSVVWLCTPAAGCATGALESVVAKLLAVEALGVLVETQAAFGTEGGGEGREACELSNVLSLGAGSGDDNGRSFFVLSLFI